MIRRAVENGAEVIVFSAVDYQANAEAINALVQEGVKIVVIDSDVNSDQVSHESVRTIIRQDGWQVRLFFPRKQKS